LKQVNLIRAILTVTVLAASAAVNGSAAAFTSINSNPGEPSLFSVLDAIYEAGNYERISDDLDGLWIADDLIGVTAVSKNSAASERLGVCLLCDGTDSVQLGPTVTEDGMSSVTLFDGTFSFGGPFFRWYNAAFGVPVVGTAYSDPGLNANGTDHMVSFAVKDRPGVFVLAFEDWLSDSSFGPSDRDFNDFIVEVRFGSEQLIPPPTNEIPGVPEPTGIALLGGALLVLGLTARRRRV
jgi:Domain of unknown function (DUF4114)